MAATHLIPIQVFGPSFALVSFFCAHPAGGQEEDSGPALDRDSAIRMAVSRNPELAMAALEIDRAQSRLRWAGRLANPELEISGKTDQAGLNENEGSLELAFTQHFPLTSRLREEKLVQRHHVALAESEFQAQQRLLAFEVEKAWIKLWAAQRSEQLQARLLEINGHISDFMEERALVGEISPLDVTQASLNGRMLEQALGIAQSDVTAASAKLRQLLGADPDFAVSLAEDPPLPQREPATSLDIERVLHNRPDYLSLLVSNELGEARLSLAMAERWEDIAVKVFLESEYAHDAPEGRERNTFAGVGFSIPLPFRNRNELAIEEAKIDIVKSQRAQAAKVFEIQSELRAAHNARAAAHRLVMSTQTNALPLAKQNFEAFQTAQQNGQASFLQVQQAQTQLLQMETSTLALRKQYHLLDAEVRFIGGSYPIPERARSRPQLDRSPK